MATRREVAQLESRMSPDDYRKLQSLFDSCGSPRALSRAEFVSGALALVGHGSEEDYCFLFDKEGVIDWPGLCYFLLLQLSEKAKRRSQRGNVPRWRPPRSLPSPHRDPIQKVVYVQSWGLYLSVSRGGTVGMWDRDLKHLSLVRTLSLHNSTVRPKHLWVTGLVLLHNLDKVAVSFTSKELCFYDMSSKPDFNCKYKIQGLKFTPWCLDYWADPSLPDQAVLTVGDIGGQVSALCFTSAQISLFESRWVRADSSGGASDLILWDELVRGRHRCCYVVSHQAHQPAWVRRVSYVGSLEAFLSCCTSPSSSLVVAWRNDSSGLRLTTFYTKRGVWDLDYHQQLKLIATAGMDHQVLLWNPYVTSEPAGVLCGHDGPVTAVCFMQNKQQLLSCSKDEVLCLWDLSSQQCLQRLTEVFPKTPEDAQALLFLHEEKHLLLLCFHCHLLQLQTHTETERRTTSHQSSVTCVLYNSLFRQVVSGDSSSCVICWLPDTGQKVTQFHRCHGNTPISTMALDWTQTRLFTASADGEVKVWDFNGRCLHRMNAAQGRHVHITQVLPLRRSVLVFGWMPCIFRLQSFTQTVVEPSEWRGGVQHGGEVVCAAFQTPQTLVTGSCNGEITVWNNSTEKVLRRLQINTGPNGGKSNVFILHINLPFLHFYIIFIYVLGGADLVWCGGSGTVTFWNTAHSCVLGQFTAHSSDLGPVVMTVSPCGVYLVTADKEGTVKTWDIQNYCLSATQRVTNEPPELLRTSRPHLDHVTHLEACLHGERLLLLSASLDSSVALSYLPGELIGYFGQVKLQYTLTFWQGIKNMSCPPRIKSDQNFLKEFNSCPMHFLNLNLKELKK
uniref:WD repeat domain 49 n=1 Tax=Periophthalmus magnuspinnatus TaxID=409849 RepID=A0A3B3ZJ46_9GOBI